MKREAFSILLLLVPLLICCNRPIQEMDFVETDKTDGFVSPVTFSIEMTDSLLPYQMDICARLHNMTGSDNGTIPMILQATSPSGVYGSDTLHLPLDIEREHGISCNRSNGHITLNWPYRRNIIVRECGIWTFSLLPYIRNGEEQSIYKNITGLGISCKKENR